MEDPTRENNGAAVSIAIRSAPAALDDISPRAETPTSAIKGSALKRAPVDGSPMVRERKSHARFSDELEPVRRVQSMESQLSIMTEEPGSPAASGGVRRTSIMSSFSRQFSPNSDDSGGNYGRRMSVSDLGKAGGRRLSQLGGSIRRSSISFSSRSSFKQFEKDNKVRVQGVMGLLGLGSTTWFVMSSVLLVLFGVQYDGPVVDGDQARYAASAAERAAVNAAAVLGAGLATRDAVAYAIKSKLYFEPMDYAAVRAALEPVFAGFPSLRAVDLAFTGRDDYITVRRLVNQQEAVGSFMSMERAKINVRSQAAMAMQSSAADCRKLGERGCLSSASASSQRWHDLASGLWGGEEADGFRRGGDEVFRWDDQPGFVPADPSRAGATENVAWSTAYSSVFRSAFPGTSGKLSVLGRSVTDLSGLRLDDQLSDEHLGAGGAIYICDRGGNLLASHKAGQQAFVKPNGGVFRFRKLNEIPAKWASRLQDFDGKEQSFYDEGSYVVVQQVRGRALGNFTAVVVAQRGIFVDTRLAPMLNGAKIVAVMPYPVFILTVLALAVFKHHQHRKNVRRVHVLHEGMATLDHSANDNGNDLDGIKCLSTLRQKTQENLNAATRNAQTSMSQYLVMSVMAKPRGDDEFERQVTNEISHHGDT